MKPAMDLIEDPIPRLIRQIAAPASLGFFFNTMYNFTDTFFGGRISTDALAALSFSFPVFLLFLAAGAGLASGAQGLIANSLGAGDQPYARRLQNQALIMALGAYGALVIPTLLLMEPLFRLMNAEGESLARALRYSRILVVGSVFFILNNVLNAGLAARGETKSYRNFLIIGFVLNIGLDPLLLYGFSIRGTTILPRLEEAGIALATILIQAAGTVYLLYRSRKAEALGTLHQTRPRRFIQKQLLDQSLPGALSMITMALGSFIITWFVGRFGGEAVAAYGSALRIEQIALIPTIGLNMALASLAGQNNGAQRPDRVIKSYWTSLLYGFYLMVIILPPLIFFRREIMGIFTENPRVIEMGALYLVIQSLTFYSYILLFQSNALLQGLKHPRMIFFVSLYRQVLGAVPLFYLLSKPWDLAGVFWGIFLVNATAALFTTLWARRIYKGHCARQCQ